MDKTVPFDSCWILSVVIRFHSRVSSADLYYWYSLNASKCQSCLGLNFLDSKGSAGSLRKGLLSEIVKTMDYNFHSLENHT